MPELHNRVVATGFVKVKAHREAASAHALGFVQGLPRSPVPPAIWNVVGGDDVQPRLSARIRVVGRNVLVFTSYISRRFLASWVEFANLLGYLRFVRRKTQLSVIMGCSTIQLGVSCSPRAYLGGTCYALRHCLQRGISFISSPTPRQSVTGCPHVIIKSTK